MQYAITVIAHGDCLEHQTVQNLENVLVQELQLQILDRKVLSSRAIDLFAEISDISGADTYIRETFTATDGYDVILQPQDDGRKNKQLFIFDMDSTLIYQEVIELIAAYADIEPQIAEITERAMNGEIDFTESLRQRVLLLKGINSTTIWEELKLKIRITNGAIELCKFLKNLGCIMGVCSGGFIQLAEFIKTQLGLDYAYANVLGIDENNILNGTVIGETVNAEMKAKLLLDIAQKHKINPKNAVAVGDGANDLKMMEAAGFGIAWNAKPKVQKLAPARLNSNSLKDITYIMGYTDEEVAEILRK